MSSEDVWEGAFWVEGKADAEALRQEHLRGAARGQCGRSEVSEERNTRR